MTDELRYESRMSDSDALMWTIEKDPLLRSTITAVSLLDGPVDAERFREKVERASRADPPPAPAGRRQPVLARPAPLGGRPQLRPRLPPPRASTPAATGGERDVLELAQWVAMQGFDRARPLWEMYLVDGMADGRSALIQKLHHAITDGVGSIQIALTLFDLERDPGDPGAAARRARGPRARLGRAPRRRRRPTSGGAGVGSLQRSVGAVTGGPAGRPRRPRRRRPRSSPTPSAPSAACSPPPPSSSAR